uniref:Uncharacterized protein n=1 Tax=Arundo donax TaxID=35708 RepID=A0A0A9ACN2_ARUDO
MHCALVDWMVKLLEPIPERGDVSLVLC